MEKSIYITLAIIGLILSLSEGCIAINLLGIFGLFLGLNKAEIINIKEELSKPE